MTPEEKRQYNRKWYHDNKEVNKEKWYKARQTRRKKAVASSLAWNRKNPDKIKAAKVKREFGITFEQYESMRVEQNNKCAICKLPESRILSKSGKISDLAVDHCHKTGKVRGLLCGDCNTALGLLKDNLITINNAIAYLTREGT